MREIVEIASCRTLLDDKRGYNYRYFLVKNCKPFYLGNKDVDVKCYGIEVIREEIIEGKIITIEREAIEHISPDKTKVIELIMYLQMHEVSPVHLVDVVGKYVDEWVCDFDKELSTTITKLVFV